MARYDASKIRNVALLGHQGSGKTTLVESLLFMSQKTKVKGEVDKKTSVSDYLSDEQKRGMSIQTSVIPFEHKETKINLIDLPGNDDFVSETLGIAKIVKGAVLLIDGTAGVQMGTIKHFNLARKRGIPTLIFINKMDKAGYKYDEIIDEIREKLGKKVLPFTIPVDENTIANIVDMKEMRNGQEVPLEITPRIEQLREMIMESVATTSDELLDKYFGGEKLSDDEIHDALKSAVLSGELVPVLAGSAQANVGIVTLSHMIRHYMPNPNELAPFEATDENGNELNRQTLDSEPFAAYVFKTVVDPYTGVINYIKVNSGVLKAGDDVYVNGATQRVSQLFSIYGKELTPISEVGAGDIAAVTRMEGLSTGVTLCSPKSIVTIKPIKYPTAVIFKAINLKNKNDEAKIGQAIARLQLEDPSIESKRNNETKQLLLGGVSDSHLDYVINKLKDVYKIEVTTEPMKVVYRESIKGVGEAEGRYVKQSGGSGFYGVVTMRFEPSEENTFAEEVFGGAVPKNYFPAVEKGFFEATKSGPLAGFPVIGVKAVLTDGKYHPVDSNEMAFKMAAILAFKEAYPKCKPIILEPIMRIVVNAESKYTGDVMSDLNTRRAKIQNIEEHENGSQEIEALVPEAEIIDYVTQLKSITQSSGFFNREFYGYEEVPVYLVDSVIKNNKITNE